MPCASRRAVRAGVETLLAAAKRERDVATPYAEAKARVRAGADPDAETRALVAAMTLEEKLGCLDGDTDFWPGIIDMAGGGYYRHTYPAAAVPRLGFPGFDFTDGPRGVVVGNATCFPVTVARGATFNIELEERIGHAIGIEARIQGATMYAGVCVNLLRHPGWGRAQETYGEDPCHVGEMGAALARGVQRWAMACVKHFACNSIENARFVIDVSAASQVLEDIYLAHFRRIVDAGVAAVMTSYNALNGTWCGENRELLTGILRERWGFAGFTMSDFVYGLRDPVGSVRAGLDVEMPFRQQRARTLAAAVADGTLEIAEIELAATNVVRTVLRFDAATPDGPPAATLLAGPAHRALAREAAAEAIVLLRNEPVDGQPVLPLRRGVVRKIALLGHLADTPNLGDHGSSDVHPPSVITPAAGLRAALPQVQWIDDPASADIAIVVVGSTFDDEGEYTAYFGPELLALFAPAPNEDVWARLSAAGQSGQGMAPGGDRRSLRLRDEDEQLIARVAAVQPRTVVLMMGGSAIIVEPWIESVAAVLHVWYPGMEGGAAIADVLVGAVNPGGRLPFAIPTDQSHLAHFDPDARAILYDRWHGQWLLDRDGHIARFPFGFGLSYTNFELRSARAEGGVIVAEIANTGARDGADVIFVFRSVGPSRHLVAFTKVWIASGTNARVELAVALAGRVIVARHAHDTDAIEVNVSPI